MNEQKQIIINSSLTIHSSEITYRFNRSSGPGGQNVNKVNSKVQLVWNLANSTSVSDSMRERIAKRLSSQINRFGEFSVSSDRTRSQKLNRDDCLAKFISQIQNALKIPKTRRATKPTRASKEKRITNKKHRGEIKGMRKRIK